MGLGLFDKNGEKVVLEQEIKPLESEKKSKPSLKNINIDWFKKHKGNLICVGLGIMIGMGAYALTNGGDSNDADLNTTPNSYVSNQEDNVTKEVINADNFSKIATNILDENKSKGLSMDPELVNSALLLLNIEVLSTKDLAALLPEDINMERELQNLLNYVSQVENHNRGNSINNRISLATLAYDELDKLMLDDLHDEYIGITTDLADKSLTEEKKTIAMDDTLSYIEKFVVGDGGLELTTGNFRKQNLSSGAGILAESYCQVIGDDIKEYSETAGTFKNDYRLQINTINDNTDGLTYINDLYSYDLSNCIELQQSQKENGKQITKTAE